MMKKDYLELGQIVNTKGLKGEVKLNSFAEDDSVFETLDKVYLKTKTEIVEKQIEKVGYAKNQVILKFKDCNSIDEAETLREMYLLVKRSDLEELPEGVYYIADLLGLDVYTDEGEFLGKVDDIYSTGANDIYVVKDDLGKQKLLPGIKEVIQETNLEEGKIIVHLIEGLEGL